MCVPTCVWYHKDVAGQCAYVGVKLSKGRYRLLNCGAGMGLPAGSTAI